ncbi:MAG: serine/threonine-protein phosphatase [Acidobacteria bacterium]|nr:MAG: serine/threonine-protein phosphatase [Acidobacteriota bacterium]
MVSQRPSARRDGRMMNKRRRKKSLNRPHVSAYAASHPGRRERNEDQWLILDLTTGARGLVQEALEHDVGPHGTLLAVADGLGGAPAGEFASALAVESLFRDLRGRVTAHTALHLYYQAIKRANRWIWEVAQTDDMLHGMGATLTTALIYHNWAYIAQIGDSRAYLVREGTCHQITEDQSLLHSMVTMGELTPQEARFAPGRHVVLQALGTQPDVQIAITEIELQNDDVLVLCTDGLFHQVPADEIGQVVMTCQTPEAACRELIRRALDRGGHDNITVVMARLTGIIHRIPTFESPTTLRRLTVFDPGEIFQRNPELRRVVLAQARARLRRIYLIGALAVLLTLLLTVLAML